MANNDDDDVSMSSSSTFSSTVIKFDNFGGDVTIRLFDRVTGIERPNVINLLSDFENNDNDPQQSTICYE